MLYLSKRLDAPVEMVTLLLSAIDEHCGATATKDSVARWKKEWKSPSSPFLASLPCKRCGAIHQTRWKEMCAFSDIEQGVTCSLFGRRCLEETSSRSHAVLPALDTIRGLAESTLCETEPLLTESHAPTPAVVRPADLLPTTRMPEETSAPFRYRSPFETARVAPNSRSDEQCGQRWAAALEPSEEQRVARSMSQMYSRMPLPIPETETRGVPSFFVQNTRELPPQRSGGRNSFGPPFASVGSFPTIGAPTMQMGAFTAPAGPVLSPPTPAYPTAFADSERMWGPLSSTRPSANRMDPTLFVRGSIATQLFAPSPTPDEAEQSEAVLRSREWDDLTLKFNRYVQSGTITKLTGNGDAREFAAWQNSLLTFFARYRITNRALQAALAVGAMVGNANSWWLAHYLRNPSRVLSFEQLLEWIQVELVPSADPASAQLEWACLTFDGDIERFFARVQELSIYNPLPAMTAQLLASRPFGQVLVSRVRAAVAQTGSRGLTRMEWEAIVRSYVLEQQALPTFQSWGTGNLEPSFRKTLMRTVGATARDQKGWQDDDWAELNATQSFVGPKTEGRPLKIGKGPNPCFVCGSDAETALTCGITARRKNAVAVLFGGWLRSTSDAKLRSAILRCRTF